MKFIGEHLIPGQVGHFFVLTALIFAVLSFISYWKAQKEEAGGMECNCQKSADRFFVIHIISMLIAFLTVFFLCYHHYNEYAYVYRHASKELENKYLLACIWEGQEGSFLLWALWHSVIGIFLQFFCKRWRIGIMLVLSAAQILLLLMIAGIKLGDITIGNSLFSLTRNEIAGPVFDRPDYLALIGEGKGLNVLLRNYWMVIHPPVLFLGFATCLVPFAYAITALRKKAYSEWIKPALPWVLVGCFFLGTGIMMGGKWAYESLSFGGYWSWDPVENAALVPWLILIAGLHSIKVYQSTGRSLRSGILFIILGYVFILYATFLTRTGILGDSSVHAFTDEGKWMNRLIAFFALGMGLPGLILYIKNYKTIPTVEKEAGFSTREFWMFAGAIIIFISALYIIARTSLPVFNLVAGTRIAPAADVPFSYNKITIFTALLIGILTAVTNFLSYKQPLKTPVQKKRLLKGILPAVVPPIIVISFYTLSFYKKGYGFGIVAEITLFALIYAVTANAIYIWTGLKGRLKNAGGSITHIGFTLMLAGMLLSSAKQEVISNSNLNGIKVASASVNTMEDEATQNLTLLRNVPVTMERYQLTYLKDSTGKEHDRKFYHILFDEKETDDQRSTGSFHLTPDIYRMKDNNMSSNPAIKRYLDKDIFTYVSYTINKEKVTDTVPYNLTEMVPGDTVHYTNGYFVLEKMIKNPVNEQLGLSENDSALMATVLVRAANGKDYQLRPYLRIKNGAVQAFGDTIFPQNLLMSIGNITKDKKVVIAWKEADTIFDFIAIKAFIFPFIGVVWLGVVLMGIGMIFSIVRYTSLKKVYQRAILLLAALVLFYLFLII